MPQIRLVYLEVTPTLDTILLYSTYFIYDILWRSVPQLERYLEPLDALFCIWFNPHSLIRGDATLVEEVEIYIY